ncbi:hypothetical protein J4402_01390 [Candidatus Pacearchaeota archaeon]|nr:hypothetical protein [Candidatus Pacearchaeota archaeon]
MKRKTEERKLLMRANSFLAFLSGRIYDGQNDVIIQNACEDHRALRRLIGDKELRSRNYSEYLFALREQLIEKEYKWEVE